MDKNKKHDVVKAGRKGGNATLARKGTEYYSRIAKKRWKKQRNK